MPKKTLVHLALLAAALAVSIAVIGAALFWPGNDPLEWDFATLGAFIVLVFLTRPFAKGCSENWLEIKPMIVYAVAYIWLATSFLALAASVVFIRSNIFPDWIHNVLVVAAIASVFFSLLNFRKWPRD